MEPRQSMDPPEEENAFLGRPPLHPSTRKSLEIQRSQANGSNSSSGHLSGAYGWRKILLLFILASFTVILLIISNTEDVAIEKGIEIGEVKNVVHQDLLEAKVPEPAVEGSDIKQTSTDKVVIDEKLLGDESVKFDEPSTEEKDNSKQLAKEDDSRSEKSTESSNAENKSAENSSSSSSGLMGFHDASPQNFITSTIHYKPKGVGYPVRPVGGLHPLYYVDLDGSSNDEETNAFTKVDGVTDPQTEGDYAISSPYADPRLKITQEEREKEQSVYIEKLQSIREEWGGWNFKDPNPDRPKVDWENVGKEKSGYDVLSGEIESEEFEKGAWQGDDEYIKGFLTEAKALVTRVKEAIYAEYGVATSTLTSDQISQRDIQLGVHIVKESDPPAKGIDPSKGVAWMHESSFIALVKKLLNAMITNDHFFVILGGHSAAAGHGNNFHQSYMMQFQEVMEPVFDRLGMILVSANRAQGGMGTIQAAFSGETIYGQKDVMLWDSSMTEKGAGNQELFHRQMLLTGHRVPILLDLGGGKGTMDRIHEESGAHVGGVTLGSPSILATTKSVEQAESLPFALRHLFCDKGVTTCTDAKYKYAASCWTDRVDVEPATKQNEGYGSQVRKGRMHLWRWSMVDGLHGWGLFN